MMSRIVFQLKMYAFMEKRVLTILHFIYELNLVCTQLLHHYILAYFCSLPFRIVSSFFFFIHLPTFFFLLSLLCLICRLENLELMSKHGADVWIQHNQRLEAILSRSVRHTSSWFYLKCISQNVLCFIKLHIAVFCCHIAD